MQLEERLDLYVDGIPVAQAQDTTCQSRVYTEPRFDPWKHILVGKANDDRSTTPLPDVELYNVTHWDKYYSAQQVEKYYRK